MLLGFCHAFSLVLLAMFGLFHIVRLGGDLITTRVVNYHAVRSYVVGGDPEESVKLLSGTFDSSPSGWRIQLVHNTAVPQLVVSRPYPDLNPFLIELFVRPIDRNEECGMLGANPPGICSSMPVPPMRGNDASPM